MEAANSGSDVGFELDTYTLVILLAGERAAEIDEIEANRLFNEHLQHTLGLVQAGHLLAAGAIEDSAENPRLTGLGFSTKTAEEVSRLIRHDPGVKAGLYAFRTVTYHCPKGALSFPATVAG